MFQKIKKYIAIMILSVLCVGIMPVTQVQAEKNYKTDAKKSVACVAVSWEDVNTGSVLPLGWGTGWFIGEEGKDPEYLVTNHHVVADFVNAGLGEITQIVLDTGELWVRAKIHVYYSANNYEEAYLVHADEVKDLAVLRLDKPTSLKKPLPLAEVDEEIVGSQVYVVGYPGISENLYAAAVSSFGEEDVTVYSGVVSRLLTESGSGVRHIQTDANIQHGNSGGPMINEGGCVIGINTWGVNGEGEQVNYAVSVKALIPILKQYSIPFEMGSNNTMNLLPFLIIGAVVAVIVVVLIIILVVTKKKKPQPVVVPPVVEKTTKAFVRSLSVQHNGMTVPLTAGQEICIGRDFTYCRVVFQSGTPGVSNRHCSLTWNDTLNQFVLIDLQSTYGTYVANGQRLTPGVPYYLRSGERFYVGDSGNMLCVEME